MRQASNVTRNVVRLGRAWSRLAVAVVELVAAAGSLVVVTAWACLALLATLIVRPATWAARRVGRFVQQGGPAARLAFTALAVGVPAALILRHEPWSPAVNVVLVLGTIPLVLTMWRKAAARDRTRTASPSRKPRPEFGDFA